MSLEGLRNGSAEKNAAVSERKFTHVRVGASVNVHAQTERHFTVKVDVAGVVGKNETSHPQRSWFSDDQTWSCRVWFFCRQSLKYL